MTELSFKTPGIRRAFARFSEYVREEGMLPLFYGGVLCALSGGADSVLLLRFLHALSRKEGFPLVAMHVHHHLRGDEADRDAAFCRTICGELSVPFLLRHVDVSAAAAERGEGIEEAARRLRYEALTCAIDGDPALSVVATAHSATDNLETVLHHLLRGGAMGALTGIHPVRGRLLRPLLCLTGEEIRAALEEAEIAYVVDSTNSDTSLTRNYLRYEILPRLGAVTPAAETAVMRMCEAVRHDDACLFELSRRAFAEAPRVGEGISSGYLTELPEAIRRRVLRQLYEEARSPEAGTVPIEHTHLAAVSRLLLGGRPFTYAVPDRLYASSCDGVFRFCRECEPACGELLPVLLTEGENPLPGGFVLTVWREGDIIFVRCFSNLHKIDTTVAFSSAIINGALYARGRLPGDSYRFFGHTHILKKLFNEKRIPLRARRCLPILCDDDGILWMPLCPPREAPGGAHSE